ncbi:MAG: mannose-6-phosphate isomerase, class I [Turicibacter sp.]|nr:mannose-6-phosphate isomerase, class I [Turicibacter sp.]
MTEQLFFLDPVFQERIWGGRALEEKFGYNIPEGNIGECWGISAHPNGESTIRNGIYAGKKLSDLWGCTPELFGKQVEEVFPLLVKVLDADADLSVQVHPDDAYARAHENGELGKTECWYIVDCADDADIIFGHNAATKEEMQQMIEAGQWEQFLRRQPVAKGDFFYVPSGTIHALCKGTIVLEVQQSSDTTYRLYDYDRQDEDGNLRDLHIAKSIAVSTVPHTPVNPVPVIVTETDELKIVELVNNDFFAVAKYTISGTVIHGFAKPDTYALISVVEGQGSIEGKPVKKGDHLLVAAQAGALTFAGSFEAVVAQP